MPRITVLPNGVTASFPRSGPLSKAPEKRGKIQGWSAQAVGRLRRWFYSVDGEWLDGAGVAITLTIRDIPETAEEWTVLHRNFLKRMRRAGLVRGQWLTEWQRRGAPHLHGCLFFPAGSEGLQELVEGHWLEVAREFRPAASGQHVKALWGLPGWLKYQAKHSARGVRHYQRANLPDSWRSGTGRLWGVVGDWPLREERLQLDNREFWRYRRVFRSWLIAEARKDGDLRRAVHLRGMLRDPEWRRSAVRAVGGFCPEHVTRELILIATEGVIPELEEDRFGFPLQQR